jgi:putative SOS response-associated peptidase YedK
MVVLMCFDISYALKKEDIELRFDTKFQDPDVYEPVYHVSAFSLPKAPVITNQEDRVIKMLNWGLIPFWVKDLKTAEDIRLKTFNARSETIFEKPSFRTSIKSKRCLVIVDGFFEWRLVKGTNYPYYIRVAEGGAFAMAGIWDIWTSKDTDEKLSTFSIITTKANPLLEMIHNKKKRMPAILGKEDERRWLEPELSKEDIYSIITPIDDSKLEAYTVSKLVSNRRTRNTNVEEVIKPHEYDELKSEQTKLF